MEEWHSMRMFKSKVRKLVLSGSMLPSARRSL